jgi:large subunit ribosomal protein L35
MPKMKSHGGTKKRFKKTGTGKVMRCQAFRDHLASNKKASVKRQHRAKKQIVTADVKAVRRQAPYL